MKIGEIAVCGTCLRTKFERAETVNVKCRCGGHIVVMLALLVVPQAVSGGLLTLIQWVSQTFIQLVMLSVIMVGQNILSRVSDKRADETYQDAEATLHEAQQIQDHLKAQDDAIGTLLDKIARLEAARGHA